MLKFMSEKCKCDLGSVCNDGLKPIHAASQCGHTNIVKVSSYKLIINDHIIELFIVALKF